LTRIHQSRIGTIGKLFPNLTSCRYDSQIVESKLGVKIIPISFDEVRDSIKEISKNIHEIERLRQNITDSYSIKSEDTDILNAGIELHLALKQIAEDKNINGFAAECWTGFPEELGLNPCLGFIEDSYKLACEGDVMLCASLLIVQYLTGISVYAGDIYDLDLDGILTLVHCGAPASLALNKKNVVLGKSQQAMERGFNTVTCRPEIDTGTVTLFRFYGWNCDKIHLAMGELLNCELSPNLKVKVRIHQNRWDFLKQCLGNHYVVVPGDIRNELRLLCDWLGITIYET
jgi:L-fucose isomerase-like protein